MAKAYIALGTNMGNCEENIKNAITALSLLPETKVLKISSLYETDPWGYEAQNCFLNGAVMVETKLSPSALLGGLLGIEAAMGRVRTIKNGPRVIDLDLLYYEGVTLNTKELTLPHPGLFERAFVLCPLCDIAEEECFKTALEGLDKSGVRPYEA